MSLELRLIILVCMTLILKSRIDSPQSSDEWIDKHVRWTYTIILGSNPKTLRVVLPQPYG